MNIIILGMVRQESHSLAGYYCYLLECAVSIYCFNIFILPVQDMWILIKSFINTQGLMPFSLIIEWQHVSPLK